MPSLPEPTKPQLFPECYSRLFQWDESGAHNILIDCRLRILFSNLMGSRVYQFESRDHFLETQHLLKKGDKVAVPNLHIDEVVNRAFFYIYTPEFYMTNGVGERAIRIEKDPDGAPPPDSFSLKDPLYGATAGDTISIDLGHFLKIGRIKIEKPWHARNEDHWNKILDLRKEYSPRVVRAICDDHMERYGC